MNEVQSTLNERTARNRSRWWLTSGDPSNRIRVGRALKGLGGFDGHFRVRLGLSSLELLAVTDRVKTRGDLGVGPAVVRGSVARAARRSPGARTSPACPTGTATPRAWHRLAA